MELKKILIDKMEGNKSIQRSDEQRNLYKALVEAYDADKTILDTYGESAILKRRREEDDDQEGPFAGSDRGSTIGTQSRQLSASESAFAEEPMQTTCQMEEPSHSVFETGAEDQPIVQTSHHPEWFSQPRRQPTPDHDWNKTLPASLNFSNFIMNRLGIDTLTPKLLAGPTYELMRGSCNSLTELEYHLEEVYKAMTNQLDWDNPEGQQYPHNLLQPLPLIPDNRGRRVIPFEHFINNNLEYLRGGASSQKYTTSVTKTKAADYGHIKWIEDLVPRTMWIHEPLNYDKHALWGVSYWGQKRQQFYGFAVNQESALDVYSKRRIIAVTDLKIVEWHNYKHLDWISVRRDDEKIYIFKEGDFKRLRLQDIKDMLLLLVQGKLSNLPVEERFAFNVSLRMFTRSIVIQRRMEDLQLGVESYQKRLNLTKPDTYRSDLKRREAYTAYSNPRGFIYQNRDKKNRLMWIDELHKFSDGTLNDVCNALDDRLKGIRMQYFPTTIWRKGDKDRAVAMIQAIDKMLKTRRIMRSLERIEESMNVQLETYGESAILKRRHEEDDDQEGPSAGSDRGSKRRRERGEHASASTPSKPATGSAGRSTIGTQSRQLSASESAFAEKPVQTTCQMEEPSHLVFEIDYGHIKWIEDLVPRAMWIQEPINYDKHALWGVSHRGQKRQQFYGFAVNQESALYVYSKRRIIAVTDLKIVEWHNYKRLDWISTPKWELLDYGSRMARIHYEYVQTKVATKQSRFKELLACCDDIQEDIDLAKERYKAVKREAKIVVARAKDKPYADLYKKLVSKEEANDIYKIAKARERKRRDIGNSRPEKSREIGSSRQQMHYDCYYSRINQEEVRDALQRMERNKAVGPDQISIEAWRCLKDEGVKWLTCVFNKIFLSAKMPDEWRLSEVIPIYKNKVDAQACSNYKGIKLLSHSMKLLERVIERILRKETRVSENQFGFMPGRSTTEAIHLLRSLMEKYRERQRDLYMAFLDLEKAYNSVSRELVWRTLRDKETPRRYSRVIKDIPYIFTLIMDELSRGIQESIPWCMIFADDIVLIAESAKGLNNKIETWGEDLEDNGLRLSREKTE
nr:hypothetical protein [Tanacetum cinerariifolium]